MLFVIRKLDEPPVAYMYIDEDKDIWKMHYIKPQGEVLFILQLYHDHHDGDEMDPAFVYRFCRERVTPPNRMNIEEILISLGMAHYSVSGFLFARRGRHLMDDFRVLPISDFEDFRKFFCNMEIFQQILDVYESEGLMPIIEDSRRRYEIDKTF